jgi:hypothetical protein
MEKEKREEVGGRGERREKRVEGRGEGWVRERRWVE